MSTIKQLMDLTGRKALVTGAAGGLGRVIAGVLAELGADLVLVDLPGSGLASLDQSLAGLWGVKVRSYECDLESETQRGSLIESVRCDERSLNILVNNAAFVGSSALSGWAVPFEGQSLETWRRAFEVNLTSVFHLCQGVLPILCRSEGASIINIGSIYGEYAPDWSLYAGTSMGNPAAYGASKGGLAQLTRWLATAVAPDVRVNTISPGGIYRGQSDVFVDRYKRKTPLARMATEEDFKGAIMFLASDLSSYVTGQNLSVDGGWGIW